MELCDESLTAFLKRSPGPLSYHVQVNVCHDIALALVYLHSNGLIHRDLTGKNVLIISGPRAKITDFGVSKFAAVNPCMMIMTKCPGNALYMPPEAIEDKESVSYTAALDIFSFGVIVIQILTRLFPSPTDRFSKFEVEGVKEDVRVVISEIERRQAHLMLIPDTHPLKPLALSCLVKPDVRPPVFQLCEKISELKTSSQYIESMQQEHVIPQTKISSDIQQPELQQDLTHQLVLC